MSPSDVAILWGWGIGVVVFIILSIVGAIAIALWSTRK